MARLAAGRPGPASRSCRWTRTSEELLDESSHSTNTVDARDCLTFQLPLSPTRRDRTPRSSLERVPRISDRGVGGGRFPNSNQFICWYLCVRHSGGNHLLMFRPFFPCCCRILGCVSVDSSVCHRAVVDSIEPYNADEEIIVKAESLAKAYVLTHGVQFTPSALRFASQVNAKQQNVVYNLPATDYGRTQKHDEAMNSCGSPSEERFNRPQELFFTGDDGYTVCVSAVAPIPGREQAIVDFCEDRLTLVTPSMLDIGQKLNRLEFVPQPNYYDKQTSTGRSVQRWVSACGYDEMNIWPWHDCAISRTCTFCGINAVEKQAGRNLDLIHALDMRREPDVDRFWLTVRDEVVSEILQSVDLAIDDECYQDEIHLIIISGNLADNQLDAQARIYADLANAITRRHPGRFAEGAVAVTAPPSDLGLLRVMRENGIEVGVFNLEAFSPSAFERHCPGKCRIGRDRYLKTLEAGVEVFGWGKSWCNFVLGLEPPTDLLAGCEYLASIGVTPGANVLHRDHGASLRLDPPTLETVINFYRELANICRRHEQRPYYCQLALRTSLANEAFAGRLD